MLAPGAAVVASLPSHLAVDAEPRGRTTRFLLPNSLRQNAFVAGYDGGSFFIEWRWKEIVVVYWEGGQGFLFDAAWGVEPAPLRWAFA